MSLSTKLSAFVVAFILSQMALSASASQLFDSEKENLSYHCGKLMESIKNSDGSVSNYYVVTVQSSLENGFSGQFVQVKKNRDSLTETYVVGPFTDIRGSKKITLNGNEYLAVFHKYGQDDIPADINVDFAQALGYENGAKTVECK